MLGGGLGGAELLAVGSPVPPAAHSAQVLARNQVLHLGPARQLLLVPSPGSLTRVGTKPVPNPNARLGMG